MNELRDQVVREHPRLLVSARSMPHIPSVADLKAKRSRCAGVWRPLWARTKEDPGSPPLFPEYPEGWLCDILDAAKERILRDSLAYLFTRQKRYLECVKEQLWCLIDRWPWIEVYHRDAAGLHADLRTGVIMLVLGLVYDWLYSELSSGERQRILDAISERGYPALERDQQQDAFYLTAYGSNWLACVLGGFGTAALATMHDLDESAAVANLAVERCAGMLEHIGPDGGWEEGPFYWAGVVDLAMFFSIVRSATAGRVDYLDDDRLKNTGYFPIYTAMAPNGRADFSDASYDHDQGGAAVFPLMAELSGNPHFQWAYQEYRDHAPESKEARESKYALTSNVAPPRPEKEVFQFITYDPSIEAQKPDARVPLGRLFQTDAYGFVVSRNGWGRSDNGVTIAAKGGNNGAPHHQLDIGQVIVSAHRERYLKDLGYGNSAGFFPSGEKIGYLGDFHKLSSGHNVVMIGGEQQVNDAGARGVILDFHTDNHIGDSYRIDCTSVYGETCTRAVRTVVQLRPDILLVYDAFELTAPRQAALRWHYSGSGGIDDEGHFAITGNKGTCAARLLCLSTDTPLYSKGLHRQEGWLSRSHEPTVDETHRYVEISTKAAIAHTFLSVFAFAERKKARLAWESGEGELSLALGRRVISVAYRGELRVTDTSDGRTITAKPS